MDTDIKTKLQTQTKLYNDVQWPQIAVDCPNAAYDQKNKDNGDKPDYTRLLAIDEKYGKDRKILFMIANYQEKKIRKIDELQPLLNANKIIFVPGDEMDYFLLAKAKEGYGIITNDKFEKELKKYPNLKSTVENKCLSFSWNEQDKEIIIPKIDLLD